MGYSKEFSTRYFSLKDGNVEFKILVVYPSFSQSSSAICGAKGESAITKGSSILRLLHFSEPNSLQQIINSLTDVLKENLSISSSIFFKVLCNTLSSSLVGSASDMFTSPLLS